jgi:hypothetical protein
MNISPIIMSADSLTKAVAEISVA